MIANRGDGRGLGRTAGTTTKTFSVTVKAVRGKKSAGEACDHQV